MPESMSESVTSAGSRWRARRRGAVAGAILCGIALGALADDVRSDLLPAPVTQALERTGLPQTGLSVYVHEIGAGAPALSVAADASRNPASTIKLLTTLAALEQLGPGYVWKTEAYATGMPDAGLLEGDLYLKGYGDPFLVVEHFWRFMRGLRHTGLQVIAGDLVFDQSHFAPEPGDPAEFDNQPARPYNVLPRALLVNFQAVRFLLQPQPGAKRLRVITEPPLEGLRVENRIVVTDERCHDGARQLGIQIAPNRDQDLVILSGRYALECGELVLFRVVGEPDGYLDRVFRALWREQGGRIDGGTRNAPVPEPAHLLHVGYSPPLADVVRSINKYSNNVMTRQLLLTLGAERFGPPGTTGKGAAAVRDWLARKGLHFPELVLDNGSGLSRETRLSARHLGELLLAAYASPFMPEFMSSLPVAALDGTLRRRFAGTGLEARIHLKTGSINGVRSMAGYLLDRRGRRVVVVSLHNHPRLGTAAAEHVQDALLRWVDERPAGRP